MPGKKYASLQRPKQYEALKRAGYSKASAAKISNDAAPGHHGPGPGHDKVKARKR